MGKHYLSPLFSPRSVAVIGASNRPDSVGSVVFKNMLESGYQGKLYPINPGHAAIQGHRAYASIEQIGEPVELAVIATQAATVPDIIEACGKQGVRAAVILSAGFSETGPQGIALEREVIDNARALRRAFNRPELPRYYASVGGVECHFQQWWRETRQSCADFAVGCAVYGHSGLGTSQ